MTPEGLSNIIDGRGKMAEGRCKMEEGTFVILSAEEEDDDLGGEDAQEHR